jgi:hypothetical protein
MLEMGEDEGAPGDLADLARAGGDVLEGAPAAGEQGEPAGSGLPVRKLSPAANPAGIAAGSLSAFSLYLRDQLAASSGRQVVPVRGVGQCGQTA